MTAASARSRKTRTSSSGSSVLTEVMRAGIGPAAIVMREADEILVIGALAAEELPARTRMVERAIDAIYPKAGA